MSPTLLREGPYRFFFYSNEGSEPPHIHVQRESKLAKLWLAPSVEVASSKGFAASELREVRRLVEIHREEFLHGWTEFLGSRD